jgi:hypothetical protein
MVSQVRAGLKIEIFFFFDTKSTDVAHKESIISSIGGYSLEVLEQDKFKFIKVYSSKNLHLKIMVVMLVPMPSTIQLLYWRP